MPSIAPPVEPKRPRVLALLVGVASLLTLLGTAWVITHHGAFVSGTAPDRARHEAPRQAATTLSDAKPTAAAPAAEPAPSETDPFLQAKRLAETPDPPAQAQDPAALQQHGPVTPADPQKAAEEAARDRQRHRLVDEQLAKTARGAARGGVEITMYSTSWCGVCKRARAYMQEAQIPFTEYDIERDQEARARAKLLNPRGSVPTITIDHELLIGWSKQALDERIARATKQRGGG